LAETFVQAALKVHRSFFFPKPLFGFVDREGPRSDCWWSTAGARHEHASVNASNATLFRPESIETEASRAMRPIDPGRSTERPGAVREL
jgi:hypothetical protein